MSNPVNAAPYVASFEQLSDVFASDVRRPMFESLRRALAELRSAGVQVRVVLIGGSLLDRERVPRDLDCVLFYARPDETAAMDLGRWQAKQRSLGLDARLIPIDVDPLIVLKSAIYFGLLYSQRKQPGLPPRGMVLVDCDEMA